ncbi:MAG: hypothetical protein ACRD28_08015, partial [Acidobacteriaceae bacterium]
GRLYALGVGIFFFYLAVDAVTVPLQLILKHPFSAHVAVNPEIATVMILLLGIFSILVGAFVMAVMGVATALCYYDLRVRKEGFGPVSAPPVATSAPAAQDWTIPPNPTPGDLPI